jgi:CRP/FNR family cyclic AMP-dependent transcriptional regulator
MRREDPPGASARLLDLDPDLARYVPEERLAEVTAKLVARRITLRPGRWEPGDDSDGPAGVLVVDGLITKEVAVPGGRATEILGPGDFVDPAEIRAENSFVDATLTWSVVEPSIVAVVDERFERSLRECPDVTRALLERAAERTARLGLMRAATHVGRVEDRLLALMWQLADRHGRIGTQGVILPLSLRHRVLGDLVGASRSTVTLALGALERRGAVARRIDGGWVLLARPDDTPAPNARRARSRRPQQPEAEPVAPSDDVELDVSALHARVASLSVAYREQQAAHAALQDSSRAIREQSAGPRSSRLAVEP